MNFRGKRQLSKLQQEANPYKLDNAQRALAADPQAVISFYATGEPHKNWEDLCRGPHLPTTGRIGAFKVTSVAGAYWHGDASKQQLQRIYGTAFFTKQELNRTCSLLMRPNVATIGSLENNWGCLPFRRWWEVV